MKRPPLQPARIRLSYLSLAAAVALGALLGSYALRTPARLPYWQTMQAAARRMARAEDAILSYINSQGIPIEEEDVNRTGLIGPEWTPLTTSLGVLEAKRTSLQPDFAALLVKYFMQAGLQKGDAVAAGMSGSFPGLCLAVASAASEMGLRLRAVVSFGASMYGGTRPQLTTLDMLQLARSQGIVDFDLVAVSPGGEHDRGQSLLDENSRQLILDLARQSGAPLIDEADVPHSVERRLTALGQDVRCFVNVGGNSANMGESPYTLAFPNGLVKVAPNIPTDADRGLIYEYAARGVPVIHLLNVRGLAADNGLPFDPVPLPGPGQTNVSLQTRYSPWPALLALPACALILYLGRRRGTVGTEGTERTAGISSPHP